MLEKLCSTSPARRRASAADPGGVAAKLPSRNPRAFPFASNKHSTAPCCARDELIPATTQPRHARGHGPSVADHGALQHAWLNAPAVRRVHCAGANHRIRKLPPITPLHSARRGAVAEGTEKRRSSAPETACAPRTLAPRGACTLRGAAHRSIAPCVRGPDSGPALPPLRRARGMVSRRYRRHY